jgi:hypothetical protein
MIARIWHGSVPVEKAERYLELLRTISIPDYQRVTGNKAALVLQRREGDLVHFTTFTLWESMDAIRTFAGDDAERAKYYDFDREYLTELEPTVLHFDAFDR